MNRTSIFVYNSVSLVIVTTESNLVLCAYPNDTPTVCTLTRGVNTISIAPGLYKVYSNQGVTVGVSGGSDSDISVENATPDNKGTIPVGSPQSPAGAAANVALSTLQSFFPPDSRSISITMD